MWGRTPRKGENMFLPKEKSDLAADRELVAGLLAEMTLAQKVGQLLMVGFSGPKPPEELLDLVKSGCAGGVILFADNVTESNQVMALTDTLQATAQGSPNGLPLFIAIDQEGGAVVRFTDGGTIFPGNMAIGAAGREEYAYQSGKAMAEELVALGINMNFAPVLDVNINPDNPIIGIRSFGAAPETVARLGMATVKGLQDGGVLAVGKHFPGHGDTAVDSHLNLPVIIHPIARLDAVELVPFQAAIRAGVAGIMTAHIVFPALETTAGRPATLSAAIVADLLRCKMNFQGLVITDCLEMEAIAANYEIGDAVVQALLAGADQLLISHTFTKQQVAHQAIMARVADGTLPLTLIDAAVGRVLAAKLGLEVEKMTVASDAVPRNWWGKHGDLARKIAAASLTLLRNSQKLLPMHLNSDDELLVLPFCKKATAVEGDNGFDAGLAGALAGLHPRVAQIVPVDGGTAAIQEQLRARLETKRPALIIVATQDARRDPSQAEIVKWLAAGGYPLVVVALRTPYDLLAFPEVDTYIAAYGFRHVTLEALAELLWGKIPPRGKLPVDLPGLYPLGYGMEHF
jgi:beta-N-acetylhexosaminidase